MGLPLGIERIWQNKRIRTAVLTLPIGSVQYNPEVRNLRVRTVAWRQLLNKEPEHEASASLRGELSEELAPEAAVRLARSVAGAEGGDFTNVLAGSATFLIDTFSPVQIDTAMEFIAPTAEAIENITPVLKERVDPSNRKRFRFFAKARRLNEESSALDRLQRPFVRNLDIESLGIEARSKVLANLSQENLRGLIWKEAQLPNEGPFKERRRSRKQRKINESYEKISKRVDQLRAAEQFELNLARQISEGVNVKSLYRTNQESAGRYRRSSTEIAYGLLFERKKVTKQVEVVKKSGRRVLRKVKTKQIVETDLAKQLREQPSTKSLLESEANATASNFTRNLSLERQFRIDTNQRAIGRQQVATVTGTLSRFVLPLFARQARGLVLKTALREFGLVAKLTGAFYFYLLLGASAISIAYNSLVIAPRQKKVHEAAVRYLKDESRSGEDPQVQKRLLKHLGITS